MAGRSSDLTSSTLLIPTPWEEQRRREEALIPPDPLIPIVPEGMPAVRIRIKVGYWPACQCAGSARHLYAGQKVYMPKNEARTMVQRGIAELIFDEEDWDDAAEKGEEPKDNLVEHSGDGESGAPARSSGGRFVSNRAQKRG